LIETLRSLSKTLDVVVVMGKPNISYMLGVYLEGDSMIVYRGSTDECRLLIPENMKNAVARAIPENCKMLAYSYSSLPSQGYILGRSFSEVAIGVIKALAKQGETIGIPLAYVDAATYLALARFWSIRDISKDLRIARSKKRPGEIDTIIRIHNLVKDAIAQCRNTGTARDIAKCLLLRLAESLDIVSVEPLGATRGMPSFRLRARYGIFVISYRWSIAVDPLLENTVTNTDSGLGKAMESLRSRSCIDLVKLVKTQLQRLGVKASIDICGVDTEECGYPSTAECLYEGAVLQNGMVLRLEATVNESIYIPKLVVVKDNNVEVY